MPLRSDNKVDATMQYHKPELAKEVSPQNKYEDKSGELTDPRCSRLRFPAMIKAHGSD